MSAMRDSKTNKIDMDVLIAKFEEADIPGHYATLTDDEAAAIGVFDESAISDEAAMAGSYHNPELIEEVRREMLNE